MQLHLPQAGLTSGRICVQVKDGGWDIAAVANQCALPVVMFGAWLHSCQHKLQLLLNASKRCSHPCLACTSCRAHALKCTGLPVGLLCLYSHHGPRNAVLVPCSAYDLEDKVVGTVGAGCIGLHGASSTFTGC